MDQYHFRDIAGSFDELLVLDVTRGRRQSNQFLSAVAQLASTVQVPISAGGGVRSSDGARDLLLSGADKVVYNTALIGASDRLIRIRDTYGQQSIVASVDVARTHAGFQVMVHNGTTSTGALDVYLHDNVLPVAGELLLNSIDRDGTGRGLDFSLLTALPDGVEQPIVLMGGIGTSEHIVNGLLHPLVDAVATSNLLNFMGDGLSAARTSCELAGVPIPRRLDTTEVMARLSLAPRVG